MSLFNNIKANIKKSFGVAADKSREALELYNLKSSVWMMKKQKRHLFSKLGEMVYEEYKNNKPVPEIATEKCQEIEETDMEIQAAEEKIRDNY